MIIQSIELPKLIDYYVAEKGITLILDNASGIEVQRRSDGLLFIKIIYNDDVFNVLKTILDKTEKITVGNQLKYEYELDLGSGNDAHIFTVNTDTGTLKAVLENVFYDGSEGTIKILMREVK